MQKIIYSWTMKIGQYKKHKKKKVQRAFRLLTAHASANAKCA